MFKKVWLFMALIALLSAEVSWAERHSQNPSPLVKPPVSKNPTECGEKGTHSWCRSGKDDKGVAEARSAQIPQSGGAGLTFAGVKGKNLKYSNLKPSEDKHTANKKH